MSTLDAIQDIVERYGRKTESQGDFSATPHGMEDIHPINYSYQISCWRLEIEWVGGYHSGGYERTLYFQNLPVDEEEAVRLSTKILGDPRGVLS